MCEACRKLKGHNSQSTTRQKVQSSLIVNSQLKLMTCSSCKSELPKCPILQKNVFTFLAYSTINILIPTKCREISERILREKPQKKPRLTHPQSQTFDSLNSSTLTLFIDISLRDTFAKCLSYHTHINEKVFWCLGSSSKMTNIFG